MKLCFPVQKDEGLDSAVYSHFGSAPMFVIFDTVANSVTTVANGDRQHQHGACDPIRALDNEKVDVVVAGGIGGGALSRLNALSIRVYRAGAGSIRDNIALFTTGRLPEYTLQQCCGGHVGSGACSHK